MAYSSSLSTATTHNHHTFSLLTGDSYTRFSISYHNPEPPSTSSSSSLSSQIRRPKTLKTTTTSTTHSTPFPKNPLKSIRISQNTPHNNPLTSKLRLTSKISPPPPLTPPPPPPPPNDIVSANIESEAEYEEYEKVEFRQEGKIFIGNLPLWIKKPEVFEFFRQFGPIKSVILIKGHEDMDRNLGFGFVIFGGDRESAEKSALKAVEFDGVEFHGRCLTVKLDDGRRWRNVVKERERWVEGGEGGDGREFRSKWHEERDGERKEFRRVVESSPENWQAVVRAFERMKKVEQYLVCDGWAIMEKLELYYIEVCLIANGWGLCRYLILYWFEIRLN